MAGCPSVRMCHPCKAFELPHVANNRCDTQLLTGIGKHQCCDFQQRDDHHRILIETHGATVESAAKGQCATANTTSPPHLLSCITHTTVTSAKCLAHAGGGSATCHGADPGMQG